MSTGMACAFLLYLYIQHEMSYDGFHQDSDEIYMVQSTYTSDNETEDFLFTMGGVAEALKKDYPEVMAASRIRSWRGLLSHKDTKINNNNLRYVDESFFEILPYRFLYGDPKQALKNPKSIVLTKELAKTLFGKPSNALQKTLSLDNESLIVTGIIENVPDNTTIPFDAVMPINAIPQARLADMGAAGWVGVGCQTIARLQKSS